MSGNTSGLQSLYSKDIRNFAHGGEKSYLKWPGRLLFVGVLIFILFSFMQGFAFFVDNVSYVEDDLIVIKKHDFPLRGSTKYTRTGTNPVKEEISIVRLIGGKMSYDYLNGEVSQVSSERGEKYIFRNDGKVDTFLGVMHTEGANIRDYLHIYENAQEVRKKTLERFGAYLEEK